MSSHHDPENFRPDQDPARDSEIDFDDEAGEEISEPDEVENEEVDFEFDDPEELAAEEAEEG